MWVVSNKRETLRSNFIYSCWCTYCLICDRGGTISFHCQRHSFLWVWNTVAALYMFIETVKFIRREGKSWWWATCRENIKCQRCPGLLERGKRCFWYNDLGYLIELDSWFWWQEKDITRLDESWWRGVHIIWITRLMLAPTLRVPSPAEAREARAQGQTATISEESPLFHRFNELFILR